MRSSFVLVPAVAAALAVAAAAGGSGIAKQSRPPNIVFLVVESTDGRTWRSGYQNGVLDGLLPNIRGLENEGTGFHLHYSATPVCCPSRATFWSGRHAHRLPHEQKDSGIPVSGVWNNYEGLPPGFGKRMDQVLSAKAGYDVKMSGKEDWEAGGSCRDGSFSSCARGGWQRSEATCDGRAGSKRRAEQTDPPHRSPSLSPRPPRVAL